MTSLGQLEEQINNLNVLNKSSAKALDSFADTSNAISVRARQITKAVKPWEVAQENIALTIEEMSKAARCYHPPPSLPAVMSKKESNPEAVARCIDYLVYTEDYLSSHPPNDYGDEIQRRTDRQQLEIVEISENLVKSSFIAALEKGVAGPVSPTGKRNVVIRNPDVLRGIDQVVQRLGENFNRTDVLTTDVFNMLNTRLKTMVEAQFDGTYREEEQGKGQLSTHSSMSPVIKHYQRGDHRLLGISRLARELVQDVTNYVQTYILNPLDEAYAVSEMPGLLAATAFDIIMARASIVVEFDTAVFGDPTKMFITSRGQGIGLCPGKRYFRDVMFVGLDLIEELWHWKELASTLPGDCNGFVDHVDDNLDRFMFTVRELLEGYMNSKGALDKDLLKEYTHSMRRTEWFPSIDCTAHECTTNLLYFQKVLLTSYYGALKLVFNGNVVDQNAEEESVRQIQDYVTRCTVGTLQDLRVIADASVELQQEAEEKGRRRRAKVGSLHLLAGGSEGARLSPEIFLVNNVVFLEENYKREGCFTKRLMPVEEVEANPVPRKKKDKAPTPPPEPIIGQVMQLLDDEKEQCISDFGQSWEKCFPDFTKEEDLVSLDHDPTQPLRSSQCKAVKRWYRDTTEALNAKVRDCRSEAVMDTTVRRRLIEESVVTVRDMFERFEALLRERPWAKHPQKYMPQSTDDWIEQIKKVF